MAAYAVLYHADVKSKDLLVIDAKTRARIKNAIETRLATEPQRCGEPLRRNLRGYWKLRVGDYRVVFKVAGAEVLVFAIMHRKDVYEKVESRM
ncbi:MAG: type II toxin-antitoxin system RelE/ParE family toxin [Deltaproteobacteria bacterium]|nr:type II toxin-antitoxin system RelE/ParE family toxin [Deltaproteobacteria bacterium]